MDEFAKTFKQLRKERGLTQQEVADAIGTAKSTVNMYERGERHPDFQRLGRILNFFNVDYNYLLGYKEEGEKR